MTRIPCERPEFPGVPGIPEAKYNQFGNSFLLSGDHGRTRNLCLLPRIDPTGFMRVNMNTYCIAQKDTQPSQTCSGGFIKSSFMLLVVVSLLLGSII